MYGHWIQQDIRRYLHVGNQTAKAGVYQQQPSQGVVGDALQHPVDTQCHTRSLRHKKYYSGVSYLLFRGVRFTGCGVSINTISRSIASLDSNVALLKESMNTTIGDLNEYKFKNELLSTQMQRDHLRYLLGALQGRLDVRTLIAAVKTLSDNVGLQLNASAYINRQVLTLAVQRDLDDNERTCH